MAFLTFNFAGTTNPQISNGLTLGPGEAARIRFSQNTTVANSGVYA